MVTVEARQKLMTLDELIQMGSDGHIEIIDGEVLEMPGDGGLHHVISGNTYDVLKPFVVANKLGMLFFDGLHFLMDSQAGGLKNSFVPDISFIRKEDLRADWDIEKPYPGVPTLAIEVISPGNDAEQVQVKVRTYLDKGTEQVWLMYPKTQEIHQYINGASVTVRIYRAGEEVDAAALFPGIQGLIVDTLFKLPSYMKRPGLPNLDDE
jgi:Uma2 family endonuclease